MSSPHVGLPLVEKPVKGRLIVRVTYAPNNRALLAGICGNRKGDLVWDKDAKVWRVARSHHRDLVAGLVRTFGVCWVIERYSETETCVRACAEARGSDCVCSCQGTYHGGGTLYDGWTEVEIANDSGPLYVRTTKTTRTFVVRA